MQGGRPTKRIYLDAATSMPMRQEVLDEMIPFFTEEFGNPSSIHEMGRKPREAVDLARSRVADLISSGPEEIIFTSGATESINLALRGPVPFFNDRKTVILSEVDHRSVRSTASALASRHLDVKLLPVDDLGMIDLESASNMIDDSTGLVTFPFASNEVGTIQPAKELIGIAHDHGAVVHIDNTMGALQAPVDVGDLGVDLMTLSSPDIQGPKGMGALYVKKGTKLASLIKGGGQERNLRSGSENVPGIVGMGHAAHLAARDMEENISKMTELRDDLIKGLMEIEDSHLNGHPEIRLPNNANVRFDYVEGESMLLMLDMNGISIATGSACAQKTLEASKTLLAMGLKHEQAHGSLVFSLGPYNDKSDISHVIDVMPDIVHELRLMSPIYNKE